MKTGEIISRAHRVLIFVLVFGATIASIFSIPVLTNYRILLAENSRLETLEHLSAIYTIDLENAPKAIELADTIRSQIESFVGEYPPQSEHLIGV